MITGALLLTVLAAAGDSPDSAAAIMAKAAANVENAVESRRQYVYRQLVRSSLVRAGGKVARRERREYSVIPQEKSTEKKLTLFQGEYRDGKQMVPYTEPGYRRKHLDIDGDLIEELSNGLTNEKDSRDGIPASLFPLRPKVLDRYRFESLGEVTEKGRRTYRVAFEPNRKSSCIHIGEGDAECDGESWKGEAWIDAEELQPVRIVSNLAAKVPWGIRVFLGIDLRQTGFTVTYQRVAENVWFPATYGTEFQIDVLWGYKRTVTLSLESSDFRKADAKSTIQYAEP